MREIKFRGLTSSGKWAIGTYHPVVGVYTDEDDESSKFEYDLHYILERELPEDDGWGLDNTYMDRPVIKETVGQFTGLLDKNGKEVYEGDIIEHPRQDRPYSSKRKERIVRCVVEWYSGVSNGLNRKDPSQFNSNPKWTARPINKESIESRWGYDWSEFHNCEIVGNIHENR